jgi:hypothetical protein
MAKIIQFPSKLTHKHSSKKQSTPSPTNTLTEIVYSLEALNDTLKYVTDGLYAISIEVNDINKQLSCMKKCLLICFVLFLV